MHTPDRGNKKPLILNLIVTSPRLLQVNERANAAGLFQLQKALIL